MGTHQILVFGYRLNIELLSHRTHLSFTGQ
jgi:hypothetical protein